MEHMDLLKSVWTTQVPKRGQASTVQGELLRAVVKLEDEATRNGNHNWGDNHVRLLAFLRDNLPPEGWNARAKRKQILNDLRLLGDYEHPLTDETAWQRLNEAVGDWCAAHPEPISREIDPELLI
jgi:hypothetical protein